MPEASEKKTWCVEKAFKSEHSFLVGRLSGSGRQWRFPGSESWEVMRLEWHFGFGADKAVFFCKMLESSVIISWEIRRSVYVQRKEKTKWTWSQLFWSFVVKRSLSEHLLWLSSVFAISHLILGRGHAPGHPQRRDKIQPCVSSLCDLGIGSWALLWPQ